jgi:hypothetical protein
MIREMSARLWPHAQRLGVGVALGVMLSAAAVPVEAAWGVFYRSSQPWPHPGPPDQSWLTDPPEKPGAHSRGKVAVFVFAGDDVYQPVRAAVVRLLRHKGLNVTTTLRPLDSAAQYREQFAALNLAVYIEGDLTGAGPRQKARIQLRSGLTGHRIATASFSGPTEKIVDEVNHKLWIRLGPATMRACSNASRARVPERDFQHIDAGEPLDDTPVAVTN